jgi:hypothetical protein
MGVEYKGRISDKKLKLRQRTVKPVPTSTSQSVTKINQLKTMEKYTLEELANRWISILRHKADYEHQARKRGEVVPSPSIDDICNEMTAFFTGLTK